MGAIQVRDDILTAIEQRVAAGAAVSVEAFVEDALRRTLPSDDRVVYLTDEGMALVKEGLADLEAGRFIDIQTEDDWRRLRDEAMAWLEAEDDETLGTAAD